MNVGTRLAACSIVVGSLAFLGCASDDPQRNAYMLSHQSGADIGITYNPLNTNGYDWWWHSLVAKKRSTGERQPFFIEYYVINPGLGGAKPVFGQLPENKARGVRPSYAMLKAGTWAENGARQIHNFYGINDFYGSVKRMDVRIGAATANETHLRGSVSLSAADAAAHPEYMSDPGQMSWDLSANKVISYSVGYGASEIFRDIGAFQMFWHVEGMKTEYAGTITYNGEIFDVIPSESYGYQDKNWGSDYTNPWVWLNCNNFKSRKTGQKLVNTSLDVGGGNPVAFGIPLGRKIIVVLYHEGKYFEYNFSKLWEANHEEFAVEETDTELRWNILAQDASSKLVIRFSNPKSKMLKINYENPRGEKNHNALWNGGHASGTVEIYKRVNGADVLVDTLEGELGGSEYGEH